MHDHDSPSCTAQEKESPLRPFRLMTHILASGMQATDAIEK